MLTLVGTFSSPTGARTCSQLKPRRTPGGAGGSQPTPRWPPRHTLASTPAKSEPSMPTPALDCYSFYSTTPPNSNRRNSHKTNARCACYSTLTRGLPVRSSLQAEAGVAERSARILPPFFLRAISAPNARFNRHWMSIEIRPNSQKTNDGRTLQSTHFFTTRPASSRRFLHSRRLAPAHSVIYSSAHRTPKGGLPA